jgi:hypothetical protein
MGSVSRITNRLPASPASLTRVRRSVVVSISISILTIAVQIQPPG